jgi:shikimate dehydrogenase
MPYAEVIGDPVAQSKSPAIHKYWLGELGAEGDYRAQLVPPSGLADYLAERRQDPDWRGCNATIPHKEALLPLLDSISAEAAAMGAVNCVVPANGGLTGHNTDVDGIAAAVGGVPLKDRDVVIIGAGGAARATLAYLAPLRVGAVTILARDTVKASRLRSAAPHLDLRFVPLGAAEDVLASAALVVNASPLGMMGSPSMPEDLLAAIQANVAGATLFDMVYQPLETDFLRRGSAGGAETIDGLTMLIGQARRAFTYFFGQEAPAGDEAVRFILTAPAEQTLSRTA